jgi:anhydro-N-acetylmuramic acid kinase
MSGTSVDAIDAVLVEFSGNKPHLLRSLSVRWPDELHEALLSIAVDADTSIDRFARLDVEAGLGFANAVADLLSEAGVAPDNVRAIGSHGQTVLHLPDSDTPTSLQIGDPHRIAALTGITVVADFRRRDMALGGQGAPLAPLYHQALFASDRENRAVLNIGGIANLTLLPRSGSVSGFDTGPGNTLMDAWTSRHLGRPFDAHGAWAKTGSVHSALRNALLDEPYLRRPPPKSTGRETFNLAWLDNLLTQFQETLSPQDVQATLLSYTTATVADALHEHLPDVERLLVCGGGARNDLLMKTLAGALPEVKVETTDAYGLHPEWVEATTFAWLAKQALEGVAVNTPPVTGASKPAVLGAIFSG